MPIVIVIEKWDYDLVGRGRLATKKEATAHQDRFYAGVLHPEAIKEVG